MTGVQTCALPIFIVLAHLHRIDKLNERGEVLFLHRRFIVDVPDKGGIEQRFCFLPEIAFDRVCDKKIAGVVCGFGLVYRGGSRAEGVGAERTPGRQYLSGSAASSGAGISNRKGRRRT